MRPDSECVGSTFQHGRILPGLRCMSYCVRCAHHSFLRESIKVSKNHRDWRNHIMSFTLALGFPPFITPSLSCQIMNLGHSVSGYESTRRGKPYKRQWNLIKGETNRWAGCPQLCKDRCLISLGPWTHVHLWLLNDKVYTPWQQANTLEEKVCVQLRALSGQ